MKKTKRLIPKALPFCLAAIQIVSCVLFSAGAVSWVFIDLTWGIESFTFMIFCLTILNSALLTLLCAFRLYEVKNFYNKKAYTVLLVLSSIIAVLTLIWSIVTFITMISKESKAVYLLTLKENLTPAFFIVSAVFFAVFYPKLPCKSKKIVGAVLLTTVFLFALNTIFPLTPYKLTSKPMVIDNGEGYSVVFSTSDKGTGYIEYNYGGEYYKAYDATGGKLITDRTIHSVNVPYEHLRNNSYKIGSVRVIDSYSYGSRLGKEVKSEQYSLNYFEGEDQTWLILTDWHTLLDKAYEAIDHIGDYDGVILLGDATPGVDFEKEVVTNIVEFGGEVSKGSKPVLYIRGNHETRGDYASKLGDSLGLDKFYYTTHVGPYSFVMLDSGEDKDDSHPEYGGTTDYNTYRADMTEWLKSVNTETDKVIALSHSWKISDVEQELSDEGWNQLDRLGARLMISGHEHQCRLLSDGTDREKEVFSKHPNILGYLAGGKTNEDFIASKMTLSGDKITLVAVDNYGKVVFEKSLEW